MSLVKVDFYTKTSPAWEAMLEDIRNAKRTIEIEQYIFAIDSVGTQFIELLKEKVKQGVKVRLLLDTVGSWGFYRSALPKFLQEFGMDVRFFNPVKPWRITNFTSNLFRDHRKILVVDDEVAQLGGVGIQEHMGAWRDTHMRIQGPLVEHIKQSFEDAWEGSNKKVSIKFSKPHTFVKKFDILTNSPSIRRRYIYQTLLARINNAQKYIYITTPYFIPDVPLYRALYLASKRGVDVRVLVPEIADHLFVNHARESYFSLALKAGIKIYIYKPVMMHAKTVVIDDEWATAGSFNLDSLSFFFNHEINIASEETTFIHELKNHFYEDVSHSKEVLVAEWKQRSIRKKFLELLTWPFHGVM
jgi:cardiolipin synthase A/B